MWEKQSSFDIVLGGMVYQHEFQFNPLTDDKFLALTKLKAFPDDKHNVTQNIKFVFQSMENIVGEEENAALQHFFFFPQCFPMAFSDT